MTDIAVTEPHAGHAADDHHPTDGYYVRIAIVLAVITAAEVAWSYIPNLPTWLELGGLLGMMGVKFALVALHFMHLKFDSKILTRLFYGGLFLAVGVYLIALFTFDIFNVF